MTYLTRQKIHAPVDGNSWICREAQAINKNVSGSSNWRSMRVQASSEVKWISLQEEMPWRSLSTDSEKIADEKKPKNRKGDDHHKVFILDLWEWESCFGWRRVQHFFLQRKAGCDPTGKHSRRYHKTGLYGVLWKREIWSFVRHCDRMVRIQTHK